MPVDVDLSSLIPDDLPDGREAVREGVELGRKLERAPSMYLEEKGFRSELEYRLHAREHGIASTCMNLGLATWAETREALGLIYEDALSRGVRPPDRFNLLAERRMGLPKHLRAEAPQETGPVLWSEQDWWELTHTVPIQAEAADNCIGGPGSLFERLTGTTTPDPAIVLLALLATGALEAATTSCGRSTWVASAEPGLGRLP